MPPSSSSKKRISGGYEITPVAGVTGLSEMKHLTTGRLRWSLTTYVNGQRIERKVAASNRTQAKKVAATMREELLTRPASAVVVAKMTVAHLYAEWIESQQGQVLAGERSSRTVTLTTQRWNTYVESHLGKVRLGDLSKAHVARVLADVKKQGRSPSTQDSVLDIISGLCRYGMETDRMTSNPARALAKSQRPTSKAQKQQRALTENEVAAIIKHAPNGWATLFRLLAESGLRISEALGLTWSVISFESNTITVEKQLDRDGGGLVCLKTEKSRRVVPMTLAVRKALLEKKLGTRYSADSDLVFTTSSGKSPGYHNTRRAFASTVTKAEISCKPNERLGLHALRGYAITTLIRAGLSVDVVSRLAGHSSPIVTLTTYSKVFERMNAEGALASQVEAAFGGTKAVGS